MHTVELEWIRKIQEVLRSAWLDRFFLGWGYVDTLGFILIVVSAVWYLLDRRIGIRLIYVFLLNAVVNQALKSYFGLPRPCQVDPSVGLLCFPNHGFPSGAAQQAILIAGIIFVESHKKLYRCLGILFALFLCFSRIYLGVHYFSDILGGLIVGGVLLVVYAKLFPLCEKCWKLYVWLCPVLLLLIGRFKAVDLASFAVGLAIGLLLSRREERGICKFVSVLVGLFVFSAGMSLYPLFSIPLAILSGLWLSWLGAKIPCGGRRRARLR